MMARDNNMKEHLSLLCMGGDTLIFMHFDLIIQIRSVCHVQTMRLDWIALDKLHENDGFFFFFKVFRLVLL